MITNDGESHFVKIKLKKAFTRRLRLGLDLKCALGFSRYAMSRAGKTIKLPNENMVAFQSIQELGSYTGVNLGD